MKNYLRQIRENRVWRSIGSFLAHYVGGIYHRVEEHHVFLLAGGLAFSMFVSIVPLVLIVFSVLGSVLDSPSIADEINIFIDRLIPYESYAEFVKEAVFSRVDEFVRYKNVAGIIGIFGLLFASSTLFSSMRTILDRVYKIRGDYSILLGKLRDFGLIVLVLVYFVVSTTVISAWEVVKELAERSDILQGLQLAGSEGMFMGIVSFVLILVGFSIIYYAVPYRKPPKRVVIISALSAAILWELAKQLFGFYITHFVMLKQVYGAYVLMIVVAFWIYYTSIVFIIGAEIGQLFRERRALKAKQLEDQDIHPSHH
ncbi:MAG: YihY/virulence factor BrkB family protein [Candidatus Zixiibacteriota bacterium]